MRQIPLEVTPGNHNLLNLEAEMRDKLPAVGGRGFPIKAVVLTGDATAVILSLVIPGLTNVSLSLDPAAATQLSMVLNEGVLHALRLKSTNQPRA